MKSNRQQAEEVTTTPDATPQFNSSLEYLKRVSWLMTAAHHASLNDDDFLDWFWVCEQLHIELIPRMDYYEENTLDTLMKRAKAMVQNRYAVRAYHVALNILAHQKGLIMTDKDMGPVMIRGEK